MASHPLHTTIRCTPGGIFFEKPLSLGKTNLREGEERLKADLRTKEAEIATLRESAMKAMASRKIAFDQRRLEAVDQLWSTVTSLGPAKKLSGFMAYIKFENAAEEAIQNVRVRDMFKMMGEGLKIDPTKVDFHSSSRARPFVSPMAWALFSAYSCIAWLAVMKLKIIEGGLKPDIIDKDSIAKLVKAALPHQGEFIDKFGDSGYHFLLDELETKLLDELQKMLDGVEADKKNIEQASEILKRANEIMSSTSPSGISAHGIAQQINIDLLGG